MMVVVKYFSVNSSIVLTCKIITIPLKNASEYYVNSKYWFVHCIMFKVDTIM